MITSAKAPSASNNAATPAAAPAADAPASPFDTILALEGLAATCNALDVTANPLGAQTGDAADASDDKSAIEVEDPLAFLAGLLNAAVPALPAQPGAAAKGGDADADDSIGDILAGKGHRAALPATDMPVSLLPQTSADDAATAPLLLAAGDAAASKLLTAMAPATTADPNATRNDPAPAPDAGTANLARAVELLGHGRHAAPAARDVISTPVRDPNWAQDLGTRVAMMVRGGESTASLQLSPVDLGPLDVSVTVRDSQATVHFGAAQAETRALLEASIPRLREMLAAQGFNLMDASVSQGFTRQPRAEPAATLRHESDSEGEVRSTTQISPLGMLDTYA